MNENEAGGSSFLSIYTDSSSVITHNHYDYDYSLYELSAFVSVSTATTRGDVIVFSFYPWLAWLLKFGGDQRGREKCTSK